MTGVKHNNSAQATQGNVIALSEIRKAARTRFAKAEQKVTLATGFNQSVQPDAGDSLFGMMLLNHFIGGIALHGLLDNVVHMPTDETFGIPEGFLAAAFEAVTALEDEESQGKRRRKLNDYPEGRRQDPMLTEEAKGLNKAFNLVAGNDNGVFASDAYAEIAAMSEILDMVNMLEKEDVNALKINGKENAYALLKALTREVKKGDVMRFNAPMRKLA